MTQPIIRERFFCSELPPVTQRYHGRKTELFTGAWVNVHTLNLDGYSGNSGYDYPTKDAFKENVQEPTAKRIKVEKYFKDLEKVNIKDLPFKTNAEVTLYDWNDHAMILEYLGSFYKIPNCIDERGVMNVSVRRTFFKGYLSVNKVIKAA